MRTRWAVERRFRNSCSGEFPFASLNGAGGEGRANKTPPPSWGSETQCTPLLKVPPASRGEPCAGEGRSASRGEPRRVSNIQALPPSLRSDKGTSLEFSVCEARTLFRPHPQPLSHWVGEGGRGARRCALQRVPPLPQAGEGDKGGEGNTAHLLVHACAGKNSPCFKDFVPNRCTLTRRGWG